MDDQGRETIGTVVSYRVLEGELTVGVRLCAPIEDGDIDRDTWIGEFRYGVPLGTKIEPRFQGPQESGTLVDVSVLDRDVQWVPGVLETNAPLFVGKEVTVPSVSRRRPTA